MRARSHPRARSAAALLALALAAGCSPGETEAGRTATVPADTIQGGTMADTTTGDTERAGEVRVTGRLTDEGVECPALRGDDGRLYTLAGETGGFGPGDRVTVAGTVAEMSFCMQGTTIAVRTIGAAGG